MDERFRTALRNFNADPIAGFERLKAECLRRGINVDGELFKLPPYLTAVCSATGERLWNRGINEAASGHYHYDNSQIQYQIREVCNAPLTLGAQDPRMVSVEIISNLFTARQKISTEKVEQASPQDRLVLLMAAFDEIMNSKGPGYLYFREQFEEKIATTYVPVVELLTEMHYPTTLDGFQRHPQHPGTFADLLRMLRMWACAQKYLTPGDLRMAETTMVNVHRGSVGLIQDFVSPTSLVSTAMIERGSHGREQTSYRYLAWKMALVADRNGSITIAQTS